MDFHGSSLPRARVLLKSNTNHKILSKKVKTLGFPFLKGQKRCIHQYRVRRAAEAGYPPGAAEGGILVGPSHQPQSKTLPELTISGRSLPCAVNKNRLLRREEGIGRLRRPFLPHLKLRTREKIGRLCLGPQGWASCRHFRTRVIRCYG